MAMTDMGYVGAANPMVGQAIRGSFDRGAAVMKASPVNSVHEAAKRLAEATGRVVSIAERLVGGWPSNEKATLDQPPSSALIPNLGEVGASMQDNLRRINAALDAIEAQLP